MVTPRLVVICVLVAAVAVMVVLTGHGPHVVGYLPFLLLFACPLMHMFMHKGHHHHGANTSASDPTGMGKESA